MIASRLLECRKTINYKLDVIRQEWGLPKAGSSFLFLLLVVNMCVEWSTLKYSHLSRYGFPFYKIGNFIQIVASSPKSDTVRRLRHFLVL